MALTKLNYAGQGIIPIASIPTITDDKLPSGVFKRQYTAKNTTPVAETSSFKTILTIPNIVVNSGDIVFLSTHISHYRPTGNGMHMALAISYSGSSSGFVGSTNWGLGIQDHHDNNTLWRIASQFVNLSEVYTNPFNAVGTFTFNLQTKSNSTNGYYGSENNGTTSDYTPNQATIFIA
jgi:hypothetical protein